MKKPLAIGLVAVLVLGAAAGAYWYFHKPADSAGSAASPAGKGKGKGGFDPNRATPVVAEPARKGDINIYLS